jgi:CO dehydrogenase maturation factor
MKIAFVGKGGSGKTTISALFCLYLNSLNKNVLAIDGDINQHMAENLFFTNQPLHFLGNEQLKIKQYLSYNNKKIENPTEMVKTTPPGQGSKIIYDFKNDGLINYFSRKKENILLINVGEFNEDDLGVKCYHSKTGSIELLLNHIHEDLNDYIVVDMTAGADAFASGLFTRFDLTCVVLEPTLKSISVYNQYKKHAKDFNIKIIPVANKIMNDSDIAFIENNISEKINHVFNYSEDFKKIEQGILDGGSFNFTKYLETLDYLYKDLNNIKKDPVEYLKQAIEFHIKNCESWANIQYGKDLTQQIDYNFQYKKPVV